MSVEDNQDSYVILGHCIQNRQSRMGSFAQERLSMSISERYLPVVVSFQEVSIQAIIVWLGIIYAFFMCI